MPAVFICIFASGASQVRNLKYKFLRINKVYAGIWRQNEQDNRIGNFGVVFDKQRLGYANSSD
jgi:hypothetical protein